MKTICLSLCLLLLCACTAPPPPLPPEPEQVLPDTPYPESGKEPDEDQIRLPYMPREREDGGPPVYLDAEAIYADSLNAARAVSGIYRDVPRHDSLNYAYALTEEQQRAIVRALGESGFVAACDIADTVNSEALLAFYRTVETAGTASLGVYSFGDGGKLVRCSFAAAEGRVYCAITDIHFDEAGEPAISPVESERQLDVFLLTEKGFLFFGTEGEAARDIRGLRALPLGEYNRELERTYLRPLAGYTGHNLLLENWDAATMDIPSYNDVFEMLYRHVHGVSPEEVFTRQYPGEAAYNRAVPAADFEAVLLRYFDLSPARLRALSVYDPGEEVYACQLLTAGGFSPGWEVVDSRWNADGSLTLTVDALSLHHGQDRIATNYLTVSPRGDGGFYYLSNRIEPNGDLADWRYFPAYSPRIYRGGAV